MGAVDVAQVAHDGPGDNGGAHSGGRVADPGVGDAEELRGGEHEAAGDVGHDDGGVITYITLEIFPKFRNKIGLFF